MSRWSAFNLAVLAATVVALALSAPAVWWPGI